MEPYQIEEHNKKLREQQKPKRSELRLPLEEEYEIKNDAPAPEHEIPTHSRIEINYGSDEDKPLGSIKEI